LVNWISTLEAMQHLGLDLAEEYDVLEDLVVEFDIDVEVDKGMIWRVDGDDLKEPLFALHERRLGHRPDHPDAMKKARANEKRRETLRRNKAKEHRQAIAGKVAARRAAAQNGPTPKKSKARRKRGD